MTERDTVRCEIAPEPLDAAMQRVRGEFMEMPGLTLTAAQAARLWAYDLEFSSSVLAALERAGFLVRTRHSTYLRPH